MAIEHVWTAHFRTAKADLAVISRAFPCPPDDDSARRQSFLEFLFRQRDTSWMRPDLPSRRWIVLESGGESPGTSVRLAELVERAGWDVRISRGVLPFEWLRVDHEDHYLGTAEVGPAIQVPDTGAECDRIFSMLWDQRRGSSLEALPPSVLDAPRLARVTAAEWDLLIRHLALAPDQLLHLDPYAFEHLIGELLRRDGYEVQVTDRSGDGGRDIIARTRLRTGPVLILVECKRYAPDRAVGVSLVRALYGVVERDRATAGLLVTTSRFTRGAQEFVNTVQHRMALQDFEGMRSWLLGT